MLEAYSINTSVEADTSIPFNSISMNKGCEEALSSPDTIELNRKGVYELSFNGSSAEASTVQLFKNGVAQPQAQSIGESPSFTTFIQVSENNCGCYCSSPVIVQVKNTGTAAATFTNCKVSVKRIPCGG